MEKPTSISGHLVNHRVEVSFTGIGGLETSRGFRLKGRFDSEDPEVLLNYPEGTTVLKELIQNADDAGATKVCLCLDRRVHGTDSLLSEKLAQWQGPALLAYNNAEFTEDDFVSISFTKC